VIPSRPQLRRLRLLAVSSFVAGLALAAAAPPAAADYDRAERQRIETLPAEYRAWLEEVELIITEEELAAFFELEKDYQRDAFIERFWRVRDVYPDTARNEYRERWEERVYQSRQEFGGLKEDRSRMLLLNGPPAGRIESRCSLLKPLEVWYYDGSDQVRFEFFVVFYRQGSVYRLWRPFDGVEELTDTLMGDRGAGARGMADNDLLRDVTFRCVDGEKIAGAIYRILAEGTLAYEEVLGRLRETPESGASEWVATFNAYSTEVDADAPRLPGELALSFPGRHQSRTVVEGTLAVPADSATPADLAGYRSYNLMLTGEVLREDELFDNFRFKYDLPVAEVESAKLPLVFVRHLRPGDYRLVVKLEDLNGGAFYREERPLSVPQVDSAVPPPPPDDEETARLLAEANAALSSLETTLQIVEPAGEIQTGYVRFDTLVTGDGIDRVAFSLDGDALLTKRTPPYSVDLDLGEVPRPRELEVVAFAADGSELARDELLINAGGNRFSVDLVEPRSDRRYERSLTARAAVEVPEGKSVERLELFLDEARVATLYQEPWEQPIVLPPGDGIAYVRAVAYLPDGNSTEDLVFVNAPDYLEEIDVQFVEVFASVLDRSGRPVEGLGKGDFTVVEDGTPQQIVRFERVRDLPIHASILLDVSASMEGKLEASRAAALEFFEQAIEPKDRAAVITFNDHPNLAVKFTNDVRDLAGGLAGLKPERGTALYDSVVFALYYFNGIKGQRALLVLSDGKDESSRFSWEQTLEYARRAGVAIYTVALRDKAAHRKLSELARATGGRSFLIEDTAELAAIYEDVQRELRSKYLVAYQSSNTSDAKDFRSIDVRVARQGAEVKAMQGYYP